MKKVKIMSTNMIFIAILLIIQGIMFCINPIGSSKIAINMMAVFFFIVGIMDIYSHFKYKALDTVFHRNGALIGILEIVIAIIAFTQNELTAAMLSYMFSLYILYTGIEICEYSITMKKIGLEGWLMFLIFSIILIIDALILIFSPVGLAFETLTMWISISLIFTGISLLMGALRFKKQVYTYESRFKQYLSEVQNFFFE